MLSNKFGKMLARAAQYLGALQLLGAAVIWVVSEIEKGYTVLHITLNVDELVKGAVILQAVVIASLAFVKLEPPLKVRQDQECKRAVAATYQFLDLWFFAWMAWLAFYIALAFELFKFLPDILPWVRDAFNLINACILFLCYLTMVQRTVGSDRPRYHIDLMLVTLVCGGLILIEFVARQLSPDNSMIVRDGFDAVNGLAVGVALALLVGRLESRLIKSRIPIIILLDTYAVIQFGYMGFGNPSSALVFVLISVALVGKVVLFGEIYDLTSNGGLTYYMSRYNDLMTKEDNRRDEFLKWAAGQGEKPKDEECWQPAAAAQTVVIDSRSG
jgi:hypothetical protein